MKKLLLLFVFITLNINAQTPITATIPFQGYDESEAYFGQAEFQIFLDNVDGVLDKPIFLVDGYDPGDSRSITQMYDLLGFSGQNLGDVLRDEGFDLVLLNFPVYDRNGTQVDGGVDYIQRNAMNLIELINQINTQKVGNEELVILGPSMGGLISRYALRFMEQNNLEHQTRLYVSWDAPHLGANIPIGFQYFINYVAEFQDNQQLKDLINATLNSPATKQMLLDHFAAHLQDGSTFLQDPNILLPTGAENFRDAFQMELNQMGFPQESRNISIANGSGNSTTIGNPGIQVIDHIFDLGSNVTADVVIHFTPEANQTNEVTDVLILLGGIIELGSFMADSQSLPVSDGVDSAPGGKYDLQAFTGAVQGNALLEEFLKNLDQSEFSFIPTISALAIDNENNWFESPDIGGIHNSPFAAWFIPDANEDHVTLNDANVNFVLDEIRNPVVSTTDFAFENKYRLGSNPVSNNINIILDNSYNYENVSISIVNITGQNLIRNNYNSVSNEINIPINLSRGVYFLMIKDNETSLSKKFIVK
jgi:pimeloyl-ACP methyl ester carboxylesterase